MSTLAVLRVATRRLINEEDSANSNFDDDEIDDYLNQACKYLGTDMEWSIQTSEATAISGQALYSAPSDFISLTDCYFDNLPISVLERDDLIEINNDWQDAPSGTPKYIYKADNAVFGLYPAPDSSQAGNAIQIAYVSIPATLAEDSDSPDLHESFQMCLPFYAAYLCELKAGNDKRAVLDMAQYDMHKNKLKSKVQRFSDKMFRFRWPKSV